MRKRILFSWGVVLGVSASASAWTLLSSSLRGWQSNPLVIHFNPSGCPVSETTLRSVIEKAVNAWNGVPTADITLQLDAENSSVTVAEFLAGTASEVPLILCDTDFSGNNNADPSGVPAATRPGSNSPLDYGAILLNAESGTGAEISNFGESVIQIIIAHELGHLLGLGHSSSSRSLMYYSVSGKTDTVLSQDDRDGIAYLYPSNQFSRHPFGCASVKRQEPFIASFAPFGYTLFLGFLLSWLAKLAAHRWILKPKKGICGDDGT